MHGLLANDIQLLVDKSSSLQYADVRVVDSKTGFPRYISLDLVGEMSVSHVKVFDLIVRLATASGVAMDTKTDGLYEVTTLDFWVLRLSLFGLGGGSTTRWTFFQDFLYLGLSTTTTRPGLSTKTCSGEAYNPRVIHQNLQRRSCK